MTLPLWFLIGSLALSAVGMGVSSWQSNRQQNKAFEQQEDLLSLQNQYNIESENRANEYNSPANQMQRLTAAGINPNAAAQSVAGGSSPAQSYSSGSAPSVPTFDPASLLNQGFMSMAGSVDNFAFQQAQIDNLKSETNKNNVEANEIPKTQEAIRKELDAKASTYAHQNELTDVEIKQLNQTLEWANTDREKNVSLLDNAVKRGIAEIKRIEAETDVSKKQLDVMDAGIAKTNAEIDVAKKQLDVMDSNIANNYADANYKDKQSYYQKLLNDLFTELGVPADMDFSQRYINLISLGKYKQAEDELHQFLDVQSSVQTTMFKNELNWKTPSSVPELLFNLPRDLYRGLSGRDGRSNFRQ